MNTPQKSSFRRDAEPSTRDARAPRTIGAALILVFATTLIAAEVPKPFHKEANTSDWPRLLGPADNATSPETRLLHELPKTGPRVVWESAKGNGFGGLADLSLVTGAISALFEDAPLFIAIRRVHDEPAVGRPDRRGIIRRRIERQPRHGS